MELAGRFFPESCIANILSFTTPLHACAFSLVSKSFCSAAGSDVVWNCFLPSDYESIVSGYSSPLLDSASSKKGVYAALSVQPIIIDDGRKSFQLDKKSGKKCYMLAARDLFIVWGNIPGRWNWTPVPESRFEEVAELVEVYWLEISGEISTRMLSPNTQYAAYLVFKLTDAHSFHYCPVQLSMGIHGDDPNTRTVRLVPAIEEDGFINAEERLGLQDEERLGLQDGFRNDEEWLRLHGFRNDEEWLRLQSSPTRRSDGWHEIEIGEFFNPGLRDEQLEMSVSEIDFSRGKSGLILEGIEVRPKLILQGSINAEEPLGLQDGFWNDEERLRFFFFHEVM